MKPHEVKRTPPGRVRENPGPWFSPTCISPLTWSFGQTKRGHALMRRMRILACRREQWHALDVGRESASRPKAMAGRGLHPGPTQRAVPLAPHMVGAAQTRNVLDEPTTSDVGELRAWPEPCGLRRPQETSKPGYLRKGPPRRTEVGSGTETNGQSEAVLMKCAMT